MANQNFSYNSVPKIKKRLKLMIKTRKWEIKLISRKKKRSKILKMLLKFIELQKKRQQKRRLTFLKSKKFQKIIQFCKPPSKSKVLALLIKSNLI